MYPNDRRRAYTLKLAPGIDRMQPLRAHPLGATAGHCVLPFGTERGLAAAQSAGHSTGRESR